MNEKNDCKHNFFTVRIHPTEGGDGSSTIVCCWCGQVRKLYANGQVQVVVHKGTIKYEV